MNASKARKDEFYTQLTDIEKELCKYRDCFRDKVVLCNCDDPFESNFFKYFAMNFNHLGLKKLICTCYDGSPVSYTELKESIVLSPTERKPYKIEITEVSDVNGDGSTDLIDVELLLKSNNNNLTILDGDGDFRSEEGIEFLKEADIVVTNPPFSLFREFISLITKYEKDFILISNTNALSYREIFKLFQQDKIRTGYTMFNTGMYFKVPDSWTKYSKIENGVKLARVSTSCWLTSLPVEKHKDFVVCYEKYSKEKYPKYDNYDAINIDNYTKIPEDYYGVMGVPITFLDKYNPNQFEIVGQMVTTKVDEYNFGYPYIDGKKKYARILIRRRKHEN